MHCRMLSETAQPTCCRRQSSSSRTTGPTHLWTRDQVLHCPRSTFAVLPCFEYTKFWLSGEMVIRIFCTSYKDDICTISCPETVCTIPPVCLTLFSAWNARISELAHRKLPWYLTCCSNSPVFPVLPTREQIISFAFAAAIYIFRIPYLPSTLWTKH